MALSLGLNYIPTPKPMLDLKPYLMKQMKEFARSVRLHCLFRQKEESPIMQRFLRPTFGVSPYQPPRASSVVESYLSAVEKRLDERCDTLLQKREKYKLSRPAPRWLIETLHELKQDNNIIITNADKNMGVAVVSTIDYIKEGLRQLQDTNTYQLLEEQPFPAATWARLRRLLIQHRRLFKNQRDHDTIYLIKKTRPLSTLARFLMQLENSPELRTGSFYLLMKVHKTPVVGRPIVSTINTPTYFASKYVDRVLQPVLRHISSYMESSQHFISILNGLPPLPANCHLLCADIESLYPNIPISTGLAYFEQSILYHNKDNKFFDSTDEIKFICDLTNWILTHNYFRFGDRTYHQRNGTAMGTPVAVVFACLFIDQLERQVLEQTQITPFLFRRYIDDIFAVFASEEDALQFINCFNNILPSIRCTFHIDAIRGEFLDCEIYKGANFPQTGKLQTRLYQKPQNKYLYLPPSSFHSANVFKAFITAELKRYRILCSMDEDFTRCSDQFLQRLIARGYEAKALQPLFNQEYNRANLLQAIWQRFNGGSKTVASKLPILFKAKLTPETERLRITQLLNIHDTVDDEDLRSEPQADYLRSKCRPRTCFLNSPTIATLFTKARRTLHDLDTSTFETLSSSKT